MTNTATWPLGLSTAAGRKFAVVAALLTALALIALAFAVGRWTVDTAAPPQSPRHTALAPGNPVPVLECRPFAYC
jgi:hypothetical protein